MSTSFAILLDGGFLRYELSGQAHVDAAAIAAFTTHVQGLPCLAGPFFALRFGEPSMEGWRVQPKVLRNAGPKVEISAGDLKPNIRQKGVDMRIGLDIASLTLKKHVQVIVLVTRDSDFIPAMKFARHEGAQIVLITLGHGVKDGLREHADLVIDQYPFPRGGN